jgi:hypothetical protein
MPRRPDDGAINTTVQPDHMKNWSLHMADYAYAGELRPISVTANRPIAKRIVENLLTISLHNDAELFVEFAEREIALALDAASGRGRWQ